MTVVNVIAGFLVFSLFFLLFNSISYYVYKDVIKKSGLFKIKPFKYKFFDFLRLKYFKYVLYYAIFNLMFVIVGFVLIVVAILNLCGVVELVYLTVVGGIWLVTWIPLYVCYEMNYRKYGKL